MLSRISSLFRRRGWFAYALSRVDAEWRGANFSGRFREEIVRVARAEIGHGESGGNNRGSDVAKYRSGRGRPGASWCAFFVSWCILTAAEALSMVAPIKPTGGARKLFRRCCRAGRRLGPGELPMPGDVVAWSRGHVAWKGHIGIVARVEGLKFWTVEGNRGRPPAKVDEFEHRVGERRLIGFARLG